jgi:hypothetical protein
VCMFTDAEIISEQVERAKIPPPTPAALRTQPYRDSELIESNEFKNEPKRQHPNSLANLKPAKPGEVRNPLGRPKLPAEIREAALAHTPAAIETLAQIMQDPKVPPGVRVTAADKIMDRALGKAPQQVDVKGEKRDLLEYSIADLVAIAYQRGMQGGSIEGEASVGADVGVTDASVPDSPDIPKT